MAFYVESTSGSYERCPPGMHLARCYRIVDLGTQKSEYMGQSKFQHEISFYWEVHGTKDDGTPLLMQDGRPYSIYRNYTLSWAPKSNLRTDLQSWRNQPFTEEEIRRFDLEKVLGKWCMLNIIERPSKDGSKIYSNVKSVGPVAAIYKQNGLPQGVNKAEIFSLSSPDFALFETFSDGLKNIIKASPEWQRVEGKTMGQPQSGPAGMPHPADDDDIPF